MIDKEFIAETIANKLDLVSAKEFAVQTAVLQRTREHLAKLEQQVADLEVKLAAQPASK